MITGSDLLILAHTLIGCASQEFAIYPLPAGREGGGREQPIHFVSPENRPLKSALWAYCGSLLSVRLLPR